MAPAWGKPSIAIIPFGRYPVERQLTEALCSEVRCVSSASVMHHGHVDWERVAEAELTGVLVGKLLRDPNTKKRSLDLQVLAPGKVILVRKKLPLQALSLSPSALAALTASLLGVLNRAHGPEREAEGVALATDTATRPAAAAESVEAAPAGGTVAPPAAVAAGASSATAAPAAPSTAAAEPAAPESPKVASRDPALLEVTAVLALVNRNYSYTSSVANPTLRNSAVPLAAEPSLQVGLFPVRSSSGLFEALGLEAGVAIGVGMELQRENDASGLTFPLGAFAANLDLTVRLRAASTVRLAPVLGWQTMNFDVYKSASGTTLTGQPGVHWRALSAGLKVDVDFSSWCTLFLELSYLYVYSAGPLTHTPYFTSYMAAPSFEGAAGLSFRVSPRLDIRVGFVFALYALTFNGSGPAPVLGVSDELPGATLGFRYND